jgi:transcriptional regulator with XRE-family HTH domain
MDMREQILARYRYAREAAGLSQRDVGKHFDVDRGTVWRWENDESPISLETLMASAELFSCTIKWLLIGEGEPPEQVSLRNIASTVAEPSEEGAA